MESLESIEYFLLEAIDQSKFFEMEESKTILQNEDKKKSISLHLKKIENGFNIHGKAFILNSNGESPLLQNSSNKEIGPKKSDYLFKFPFSRTASINSFKYYEENRSDVAFRESFSPGDKKKNIEKKTEVVEKKKIKNFQTCDFFRCGFF